MKRKNEQLHIVTSGFLIQRVIEYISDNQKSSCNVSGTLTLLFSPKTLSTQTTTSY